MRRSGGLMVSSLVMMVVLSARGDDAPRVYTPVAPRQSIHVAVQANLKIVRDWINDKDYTSAGESAQIVAALAQLYSAQSTQPAWREKAEALKRALEQLQAAARDKNDADCKKALLDCERALAEMQKNPPPDAKATHPNFKPVGNVRSWMLLLDGTYSDAKSAKNVKDVEHLTFALAEAANALQYANSDPRWREKATAVREAALKTADQAKRGEMQSAQQSLRAINAQCTACHQMYKK